MANVYVRSGAGGAATGADWANAYLTLAAAFTAKAAGDTFWVSEDHAESTAGAVTLTSPGSESNPCHVYCVNHSGSVPPVSADLRTTATVLTTGANALTLAGSVDICYGITFTAGNLSNNASLVLANTAGKSWKLVSCALVLGGSSVSARFSFGNSTGNYLELVNTTVQFSNASQFINFAGFVVWRNTPSAIAGATLPTQLGKVNNLGFGANVLLEGVDLSALGSGKTLIDTTTAGIAGIVVIKDCKLGASVTIANTSSGFGFTIVDVIRCDSAATNYRTERYRYAGTETVETTIVRTGGATDGTTPIAHKIVTTANSKWALPFEAIPIAIWNDSTSSITVTVYGISAGALNNDDIWMDVEYLGAAGNPQGSFATTTKADGLATGSALTSDSSTWGGSTTKFKMSATFTPAQKGAIYIYVKAAKASTTFYIDPKPDVV